MIKLIVGAKGSGKTKTMLVFWLVTMISPNCSLTAS